MYFKYLGNPLSSTGRSDTLISISQVSWRRTWTPDLLAIQASALLIGVVGLTLELEPLILVMLSNLARITNLFKITKLDLATLWLLNVRVFAFSDTLGGYCWECDVEISTWEVELGPHRRCLCTTKSCSIDKASSAPGGAFKPNQCDV